MSTLTQSACWKELLTHRDAISATHLSDLLKQDALRATGMVAEAGPLFLDYSRQRVTRETLTLLHALLAEQQFESWREQLFSGARLNTSENRAALHTALRDRSGAPVSIDGVDVTANIRNTLTRMHAFSAAVRDGTFLGATGEPITDILCLGIGGSDLGPRLVCAALDPRKHSGPRLHFVANLDGADFAEASSGLDPATTLVVVSSKTFSTQETMANLGLANGWLSAAMPAESMTRHLIAVTANPARAHGMGIPEGQCFHYWDWVGGRFSVWSAVGLPIALGFGFETFDALLQGAHDMDLHFHSAPAARNMPVLMALLGIWNRNFLGAATQGVFPYSHALAVLPAYLQQLEMESLGKSVDREGKRIDYATAPVIWGGAGTTAQHSVFQWLHQGTDWSPVDFILPIRCEYSHQQPLMMANLLAQADGLAHGTAGADGAHQPGLQNFDGNRPSSILLMDRLDARGLGALLALYEHKVFTQSVVWNVNPFDQQGVELGKQMAKRWSTKLDTIPADTPLLSRLLGK